MFISLRTQDSGFKLRFVRLREARERPRSVAWQHDASAMISLNPPESFSHIFGSSGAARSDRTGAERLRRY